MEKFAVIKINNEQFLVEEGETYSIKGSEYKKGEKVEIKEVLLTYDGKDVKVGQPVIEGATVTLEAVANKKGKKVDILKYKAKARYRRAYGSREILTNLKVIKIKY